MEIFDDITLIFHPYQNSFYQNLSQTYLNLFLSLLILPNNTKTTSCWANILHLSPEINYVKSKMLFQYAPYSSHLSKHMYLNLLQLGNVILLTYWEEKQGCLYPRLKCLCEPFSCCKQLIMALMTSMNWILQADWFCVGGVYLCALLGVWVAFCAGAALCHHGRHHWGVPGLVGGVLICQVFPSSYSWYLL